MFSFLKSNKAKKADSNDAKDGENQSRDQSEGFFSRLKQGLSKGRHSLTDGLANLVLGAKTIDDDLMEQIEDILITADLVVLASAIVPRDNAALAQMFKLSLNEDGFFMEAHAKLRPVEFATEGIFLAGIAHYPKPIEESIAQAKAAASRASVVLSKEELTVEGVVSHVTEIMCRGCGKCVEACPYNAVGLVEKEDDKSVAYVQEALCKGCGACAVACPTGAASIFHFDDQEVLAMVEAALN